MITLMEPVVKETTLPLDGIFLCRAIDPDIYGNEAKETYGTGIQCARRKIYMAHETSRRG